jgi:hypothetical protein
LKYPLTDVLVPEESLHEFLGITPEPARPLLGMDLGVCLNITDGGPKGKWIKVRSVEQMLRFESERLDLPVLSLIADRLCEWARIAPARSLDKP